MTGSVAGAWSGIASIFNCRLCWRVTIGVFAAILVVEAAILFFSVKNYERDRLAELEREAVVVTRAIIRSTGRQQNPASRLPIVAERLRQNSVLVGAKWFDKGGTKIAEFGELPVSFGNAVGRTSKTIRLKSDGNLRTDVLWPPRRVRAPYFVAARIDTSEIDGAVNAFIWRITGLVLLISTFVTMVTMLVLERMVLSPIRILRDRMVVAGSNPEEPEKHIMNPVRSDEWGDVVDAFNRMLRRTGSSIAQIRKQEEELQNHRDRLENLVAERTAKLETAKKAAEVASHAKTEFLAHMSHELRTPLNAIIGFSQMWVDEAFGPLPNPTYLEYAKDVNRSGMDLLQTISDILDLTTIDTGEIRLNYSDIDLETTIPLCIGMVETRSRLKRVTIQTRIASALPPLRADERLFRRTIVNIIENAVKFTPQDGSIEIEVEAKERESIIIRITDSGQGIGEGDIQKVLEPFGQVREGSHLAHEGAGVGLSLAKSFTDLHGGSLTIESELGRGTIVSVEFPCKPLPGRLDSALTT